MKTRLVVSAAVEQQSTLSQPCDVVAVNFFTYVCVCCAFVCNCVEACALPVCYSVFHYTMHPRLTACVNVSMYLCVRVLSVGVCMALLLIEKLCINVSICT